MFRTTRRYRFKKWSDKLIKKRSYFNEDKIQKFDDFVRKIIGHDWGKTPEGSFKENLFDKSGRCNWRVLNHVRELRRYLNFINSFAGW